MDKTGCSITLLAILFYIQLCSIWAEPKPKIYLVETAGAKNKGIVIQ